MVAERAVLQTQVSEAVHEKERLEEALRQARDRLEILEVRLLMKSL
jgi:hypothetical protein